VSFYAMIMFERGVPATRLMMTPGNFLFPVLYPLGHYTLVLASAVMQQFRHRCRTPFGGVSRDPT
jgi:hypothetical protein